MNHQGFVIEEKKDLRLEFELPKPTCFDDWPAQAFNVGWICSCGTANEDLTAGLKMIYVTCQKSY